MKSHRLILSFLLIGLVFTFNTSLAAINSIAELDITVSPEHPGPEQKVKLSLASYVIDINRSNISWAVNGKVIESGTGKTTAQFTNGKIGSETIVTITATTATGAAYKKTLTFRPARVNILWQADSYVPPFYKGKALHSSQSNIKVSAFPEVIEGGVRVAPGNLIYKWFHNDKVLQENSGFGKSEFTIAGAKLYGADKIRVEVGTKSGKTSAYGTVNIPTITPKIRAYEEKSLIGTWYNQNIFLSSPATQVGTIRFEPYFSTLTDWKSGISYLSLFLDGGEVSAGEQLYNYSQGENEQQLRITLDNRQKVLQDDTLIVKIPPLKK